MLNFLFIVLLIIIIVPYILRWAAPFLMKSFLNRMQKNMQNKGFPTNETNDFQSTDEQVPNNQSTKEPTKAKEELGDYVDFEELKED